MCLGTQVYVAWTDVIEVLERNAHLEGEKIVLEKELVTKASRLEGEVVRLQSDLFASEAATEAAEEELNKHKSKADSLNKALEVINLRSAFMIGFNLSSIL